MMGNRWRVMRPREKRPPYWVLLVACLALFQTLTGTPARDEATVRAEGCLELGIDSSERRYFSPIFRFAFPTRWFTIDTEVMFQQRANSRMSGAVDYWLNLGVSRSLGRSYHLEGRLQHMCRHLAVADNPTTFNLNELFLRAWRSSPGWRLGLGVGGYTGGSVDYSFLLLANLEFPRIFGSDVSVLTEWKWRDGSELLYDLEVAFSLNPGVELFVRHSLQYEFPATSYIGLRLTSAGRLADHLDAIKLITGFYPYFERHKINVEGEFLLAFFRNDHRRVLFSMNFVAPILRDDGFWGTFFPDHMVYPFTLEYQRRLGERWHLSWFAAYRMVLPLDVDDPYRADLGTGLRLRNVADFDHLDRPWRLEISTGVNFKHGIELGLKFGMTLMRLGNMGLHGDLRLAINDERVQTSLGFFLDTGRRVSVRPFVRLHSEDPGIDGSGSDIRFLFGVGLFHWSDDG